jgi:hypothetical protein
MNGIVKELRRGGWSGRGLIETVQHGQLFQTQIGPKAFASKEAAVGWLQEVAAERDLEMREIVLEVPPPGHP